MLHKKTKLLSCFIALTALSALLLTACGKEPQPQPTPAPTPTTAIQQNPSDSQPPQQTPADPILVIQLPGNADEPSNFDQKTEWSDTDTTVSLSGSTADIKGEGCKLDGSVLRITVPGTYVLSGSFNGQVSVHVDKLEKVRLVLNNANISCADGPAIIITSADKVGITLADGTANTLSDGTSYAATDSKAPNACVYSKDDLSINGGGALTVNANFHNGIDTSNDLRLVSGEIHITAKNHALKGNDSVCIFGGEITVDAGKDGIKSDTEGEAGKGFVYMSGGNVSITAADDGIQAVSSIRIDGGSVSFKTQGDTTNCDGTTAIAEGVIK